MINTFKQNELTIKAIISINIFLFIVSLLVSGSGTELSLNPFTAFSPSSGSLIFLGATGTIPIDHYNEWWSIITASWLHGSLLHIIFNMIALTQTIRIIISAFGIHRMIIIYSFSGAAGFYLSYIAGVSLTIGASAAICGLIGAALYYGRARGGFIGREVFRQTSGWVISLAVFGLAVPGINNWGHGGGLAGGVFAGWLVGYQEKNKETLLHFILSSLCIFFTLMFLVWRLICVVSLKF